MANFAAAASQELHKANADYNYTNARYAPTGTNQVGVPFPAFKQSAGQTFTDWRPAGSAASTTMKRFNLPTNTNFFRQAYGNDAIGVGNQNLNAWVYRSQTLGNHGDVLSCNVDQDCSAWPGTTCNKNYESWPSAKGNQSGTYCSYTVYPELNNGHYSRKLANEGGIGKSCTTDKDCGQGYSCNNETDFIGRNLQQTGYCAMKYQCPDGSSHFLGTPYNSGIPQPPPSTQNNNGQGYNTEEECHNNSRAQQNCKQGANGKFYAVFPGYCPVPSDLRQNNNPSANVFSSSPREVKQGFRIPTYATSLASDYGTTPEVQAFSATNMSHGSHINESASMNQPFQYASSLDPPPNGNY